jgi:hypothetical protein
MHALCAHRAPAVGCLQALVSAAVLPALSLICPDIDGLPVTLAEAVNDAWARVRDAARRVAREYAADKLHLKENEDHDDDNDSSVIERALGEERLLWRAEVASTGPPVIRTAVDWTPPSAREGVRDILKAVDAAQRRVQQLRTVTTTGTAAAAATTTTSASVVATAAAAAAAVSAAAAASATAGTTTAAATAAATVAIAATATIIAASPLPGGGERSNSNSDGDEADRELHAALCRQLVRYAGIVIDFESNEAECATQCVAVVQDLNPQCV